MSQFNYVVEHRSGESNIADYYSRHPLKAKTSAFLEEVKTEQYINLITRSVLPDAIMIREIVVETKDDVELQNLIECVQSNVLPKNLPNHLARYKSIYDELNVTSDGVLLRGQRIVVPIRLRRRVLELAHAGHQGMVKTKMLIRSRVWYPGIDSQVEDKVKSCLACQTNVDGPRYEPMRPSAMPEGPWQMVSGDFYGPKDNGQYYFVNHCDYSRFVLVDEVKSVSFCDVKSILERHFSIFGTPYVYKSDNGSPFQSHDFAEFAKHWGFRHQKITPLWPRANAEVESFMKKLGKVLRIANVTGTSKALALQTFLRAYRETPHCTTRVPPALLMLGYSRTSGIPALDMDASECHKLARENDVKAKQKMKVEYDKRMNVKESSIREGSKVVTRWCRNNKSKALWDPLPYVVTNVKGTMVTAKRDNPLHQLTRNSSKFKEINCENNEENTNIQDDVVLDHENDVERNEILQNDVAHGNERPLIKVTEVTKMKEPVGRPTKARQIEINEARSEALAEKEISNPPLRKSGRLQAKSSEVVG